MRFPQLFRSSRPPYLFHSASKSLPRISAPFLRVSPVSSKLNSHICRSWIPGKDTTLNQLFFSMHIIKEQTTSSISNTMSNILVLIFLQYFKIKKISKWSYMKLYINLCFFSTGANFCLFSKISTF